MECVAGRKPPFFTGKKHARQQVSKTSPSAIRSRDARYSGSGALYQIASLVRDLIAMVPYAPYGPDTNVRLLTTSDFTLVVFLCLADVRLASATTLYICACTTFDPIHFFPWVIFHSGVTGACPVTTESIVRVDVRTPTTTDSPVSTFL